MKPFLSTLYTVLGWLMILLLLLSYLSPYVNANKFWFPGILGLTFLVGYSGSLIFFIAGFLFKVRVHWYLGAVLLVGLYFIPRQIGWHKDNPTSKSDLNLVSFNTWGFGNLRDSHGQFSSKKIEKVLIEKNVDVVVFQEWRLRRNKISKELYPHSLVFKHSINSGVEIMSKHKIINGEKIDLPSTDSDAGYANILVGKDTIRVYALHLESHKLTPADYHRIKGLDIQDSVYQQQAMGILRRLKYAMQKQSEQALIVRNHMKNCPYPIFVCADINNTSMSFAYQTIKGNLLDAFIKKGNGIGATFNKPFPLLRIDYILYDDEYTCNSFKTNGDIVSDHKLIFASFSKTVKPQ